MTWFILHPIKLAVSLSASRPRSRACIRRYSHKYGFVLQLLQVIKLLAYASEASFASQNFSEVTLMPVLEVRHVTCHRIVRLLLDWNGHYAAMGVVSFLVASQVYKAKSIASAR